MKKFHLRGYIELYIINECNLTCSNCNRYNNYNFSGHYDWQQHEKAILTWGQRLSAQMVTIIGGEPFLHPDLLHWSSLVKRAWPEHSIIIQSNGTVYHHDIDEILKIENLSISVAVHHPGLLKKIKKTNSRFVLKHNGSIKPNVAVEDDFSDCALVDRGLFFEVYDSDNILESFNACTMKYSHTIFQGRLYKCPMVAVLPEFRKQFNVRLSQQQQELLESYPSLSSDCSDAELEKFLNEEDSPIPQCKLCPKSYETRKITFDANRKTRQKITPG